jgi:hypothetical protein
MEPLDFHLLNTFMEGPQVTDPPLKPALERLLDEQLVRPVGDETGSHEITDAGRDVVAKWIYAWNQRHSGSQVRAGRTPDLQHLHNAALHLWMIYQRVWAAKPGTKAEAVALGELEAACNILDRLGLVESPTQARLACKDTMHEATHSPPPALTAGSTDWNHTMATKVAWHLGWLEDHVDGTRDMAKVKHTVKAASLEEWTGYSLASGNTIDAVHVFKTDVFVTTRTPVDAGARPTALRMHADEDVDVFGPV